MRYICAITILVLGMGIPCVEAVDMRYWDVNASANLQSGSGTWDDSTTLWSDSTAGSSPLLSWSPDGVAYFTPDGPATVTVAGGLTAAGLVFDGASYTVEDGILSLGATGITANVAATIGSIISGTNGLLKQGAGTLTLTGVNDYLGTTTIGSGALQLGANTTTGNLGGGPVDLNGMTLTIDRSNAMTFTNALSGAGTIIKKRSSTTTYGGISTFSGAIQLDGGTFVVGVIGTNGIINGSMTGLGSINQIQNVSASWDVDGVLDVGTYTAVNTTGGTGSGQTWESTLAINSGATLSATTINGAHVGMNRVTAKFFLNVNTGGTATATTIKFSDAAGASVGNNVYNTLNIGGELTANSITAPGGSAQPTEGGSVRRYINLNSGGRLNATTIDIDNPVSGRTNYDLITLNGGTLANITSGNLNVETLTMRLLGSSFIEVSAGHTITIKGQIYDSGNLIKTGEGTLTFTGAANTYTGDTIVSNGVLSVSHSWLGGSNATVRIATGATVNLGSGVNAEVGSIYMGGFQYQAGTWGGPDSEAQFKKSGYFTGTGMITVQEGVFSGLMYYAL